ncbi:hypothetical protein DFR31_1003 [Alkalispirillum mobile]|uniref:Uncharacterized protein n=1 Tax=Alkalispirillum mobile TaxID=85925 RepID=A0A498C7K4_9GAMM|nr:hypothetical protein [Alkalispirillum mobile]RLK51087.1 hypothetical protein DFR31_1003 [Alkalispirillum mobile]
MKKSAGYILRFSAERQQVFDDRFDEGKFAEAVPEFEHSRNVPLVCFVVSREGNLTHICLGSRGRLAGTDLRRLNMGSFFTVKPPIPANKIISRVSNRSKSRVEARLSYGGLLSPKAFEEVISAVSDLSPESAPILAKYREERRTRIATLPGEILHSLAEQKEAVGTALGIAGIDRNEISGWDYSVESGPVSFIAGLPKVRLREDQMVANDLKEFPGHEEVQSYVHGSTVFENTQSRLTVILANRLPLEEQTGTDLIYYNETFQCFLMVQYKAMEHENGEAVFRFPNSQLTEEIRRMDALLTQLGAANSNTEADGFRLSENPFFLKICPRLVFNPDNIGLSVGMYLPLDYWKLISMHPDTVGPKGGKRLSYKNVRRYFGNTEFINIASGGWVGTNIHQSSILRDVIRSTLESGRAAVIAVNEELDDRHRRQDDDGS